MDDIIESQKRYNNNFLYLACPRIFIKSIFDSAQEAGKKISICGELGGDPMITLFLLGFFRLCNTGGGRIPPPSLKSLKMKQLRYNPAEL